MTEDVHKSDCDGSRPLPNRKREMFARMLFEGIEACAAYELAGFKRPRGNEQRALVEGLEADGLRPILPGKLQAMALIAKLDGLDQPTRIAPTNADGTDRAPLTLAELIAASINRPTVGAKAPVKAPEAIPTHEAGS
jgi:hypothetical protein